MLTFYTSTRYRLFRRAPRAFHTHRHLLLLSYLAQTAKHLQGSAALPRTSTQYDYVRMNSLLLLYWSNSPTAVDVYTALAVLVKLTNSS